MNKRHIEEFSPVWPWIRVQGSTLSDYMQFGGCRLGLNWSENEWDSMGWKEGWGKKDKQMCGG